MSDSVSSTKLCIDLFFAVPCSLIVQCQCTSCMHFISFISVEHSCCTWLTSSDIHQYFHRVNLKLSSKLNLKWAIYLGIVVIWIFL